MIPLRSKNSPKRPLQLLYPTFLLKHFFRECSNILALQNPQKQVTAFSLFSIPSRQKEMQMNWKAKNTPFSDSSDQKMLTTLIILSSTDLGTDFNLQVDRLSKSTYRIHWEHKEINFHTSHVINTNKFLPFSYKLHSLFYLKSPVNKRQKQTLSVKSPFLNPGFRNQLGTEI